jgi:hypothetical protein
MRSRGLGDERQDQQMKQERNSTQDGEPSAVT